MDKKENVDRVIEQLQQKVSANTQNKYYQNKILMRDCKEFYNLLRQNKYKCEKCTNQIRNRELL
jgi:hypothetical protein